MQIQVMLTCEIPTTHGMASHYNSQGLHTKAARLVKATKATSTLVLVATAKPTCRIQSSAQRATGVLLPLHGDSAGTQQPTKGAGVRGSNSIHRSRSTTLTSVHFSLFCFVFILFLLFFLGIVIIRPVNTGGRRRAASVPFARALSRRQQATAFILTCPVHNINTHAHTHTHIYRRRLQAPRRTCGRTAWCGRVPPTIRTHPLPTCFRGEAVAGGFRRCGRSSPTRQQTLP